VLIFFAHCSKFYFHILPKFHYTFMLLNAIKFIMLTQQSQTSLTMENTIIILSHLPVHSDNTDYNRYCHCELDVRETVARFLVRSRCLPLLQIIQRGLRSPLCNWCWPRAIAGTPTRLWCWPIRLRVNGAVTSLTHVPSWRAQRQLYFFLHRQCFLCLLPIYFLIGRKRFC